MDKQMTSIEWLEEQLPIRISFSMFSEIKQAKEMYKQEQDNISAQRYMDGYNKAKEMLDKEICKFAEFVSSYPDKNRNVNGEMLHAKSKYDGAERTIDLLEIFRNK